MLSDDELMFEQDPFGVSFGPQQLNFDFKLGKPGHMGLRDVNPRLQRQASAYNYFSV